MPHRVPDYFKYVSSITVTNGGTGYNSTPTVTISAPTGTPAVQATATATVVNNIVTTINIQNSGSGYEAAPTVTIDAPPSGTTATATSEVRIALGSPDEYTKTYKNMAKYSLPEFVRSDYDKFTTFIEKYFEYMDQTGKPGNLLFNTRYFNIDDLEAVELNKRALELARDFPQVLEVDAKLLYKHIKTLYEAKGSERAIKAYFKLLYNEDISVTYPTKTLLRTNDGDWRQLNSIRALAGYNGYDAIQLNGLDIDVCYYSTANYYVDESTKLQTLTGSWTATTSSTTVTSPGADGSATTEVSVGQTLKNTAGLIIGRVASITDDDTIELTAPAVTAVTNATIDLHSYAIRESNTVLKRIPCKVEKATKIAYTSPTSYELFLSGFTSSVTDIPGPGYGGVATPVIEDGVLSTITITSGGTDATRTSGIFRSITPASTSGSGTGAKITVQVDSSGIATLSDTCIVEGGSGYAASDTITLSASNVGQGADDLVITVSAIKDGVIKSVTVTNAGLGYDAAPIVNVTDTGSGTGASIVANVDSGNIISYTVNQGGRNYSSSTTSISLNVSDFDSFIVLRGDDTAASDVKATLKRVLRTVSSGTYVGSSLPSDAGFRVGQSYRVKEGSASGTLVRVKSVNSNYIPQTWSIVSPGEGWTRATSRDRLTGTWTVSTSSDTITAASDGAATTEVTAGYVIVNGDNEFVGKVSSITDDDTIVLEANAVNALSAVTAYQHRSVIESVSGEEVFVELGTKYYFPYSGKFVGTRGQLSERNKLNDNRRNQIYSYIISSGIPQSDWDYNFRKHMHPAGKEVFGDVLTVATIPVSVVYSTPDGLSIYKFITEDLLEATDLIEKLLEITLTPETVTVTDLPAIAYSTSFTDSVTAAEGCSPLYVDDDYWYGSYAGTCDVYFDVGKNINLTATTSEVVVPVVAFNRTFTSSASVSEALVAVNTITPLTLSSTATTSDAFAFSWDLTSSATASDSQDFTIESNKFITESTSNSDSTVINTSIVLVEPPGFGLETAPDVLDEFSAVVTWSRSFTDSTSGISDSGTIVAGQDYVDPTYLATPDDYIGGSTLATF